MNKEEKGVDELGGPSPCERYVELDGARKHMVCRKFRKCEVKKMACIKFYRYVLGKPFRQLRLRKYRKPSQRIYKALYPGDKNDIKAKT